MTSNRQGGLPSPAAAAADLTRMLDAVLGTERYPVNVEDLLLEVSRQRFPNDPVLRIVGDDLQGFEGALMPIGRPRRGWGVLYSKQDNTPGRQRFTVAHEAGHYFLHRHLRPDGIRCDATSITRRDGQDIEREADTFAAARLMPFHDLRKRLPATVRPSIQQLSSLSARYGVSLTALVLRWLEYTERRSLMVVSREGYALWARSSEAAVRTGCFIRTAGAPYELPAASLTIRGGTETEITAGASISAGVWFPEPVHESAVVMDRFEKILTIIHAGDRPGDTLHAEAEVPDTLDLMQARIGVL